MGERWGDKVGSRHVGDSGAIHNDLSGGVSGHVVQAGSVGEVHFHAREPDWTAPAQLPLSPTSFAGRDSELTELRRLRATQLQGPLLVVLTGPAGVGKTSLALRWMHEFRDEFPDGQLFAELGGAQPNPVPPADVLDWFLVSTGTPPKRVPVEQPRREALYRSVTANRRLMVLLDNAVSATQVRALLPAGAPRVVVVTSRFRLSGLALDGARWVDVQPLDRHGSLLVLREMLGADRVRNENTEAEEIAGLCGGLPLALSLVGARLATRPQRSLRGQLAALRDRHPLRSLPAVDELSVAAVLDASYEALGDDAEHLYRRCAWHPGREFGVEVAAAAADWSTSDTESAMDDLVEANFVAEIGDRRFTYHDLLRLHAQQRWQTDEASEQAPLVRRMVDWYLRRAVSADVVIHPLRPRLGPQYQRPDPVFAAASDALSWLEIERTNLRAAVDAAWRHKWYELVWQLCEALWGFFLHTRHYSDWIEMNRTGIAGAHRCGDRRAEARMRSQLGYAFAKLHRFDESITENTQALRLAEAEHDEQGRATALSQLGRVARDAGDLQSALGYYGEARDVQQALGNLRGVALCRRRIGDVLSRLGNHEAAVVELRAAAAAMAEAGDHNQHARTLMFLGAAHLRVGRTDLAATALDEALVVVRALGSPYYQAEVLARLGELAAQHGDRKTALDRYREAEELYGVAEDPQAEVMRSRAAALRSA
jgi:tetratricopeptide (TPR) repeat protein